jgi:processive 1,2-diacylglycerol beta-glucosyltransferase
LSRQRESIQSAVAEHRRVLILYSDIGEGHASAARALATELGKDSPQVDVMLENGFAHVGRLMCFLQRDVYHAQLGRMPWLYGVGYGLFSFSRLARAAGAFAMCALGSQPLLHLVDSLSPDVIVSTDPRVSVVLGHLRMRGRVSVPVCATLTDLGGLKFWVHPGVDVHLAPHPGLLAPVERMAGPGSATLVRPPVDPKFWNPLDKTETRRMLGLPLDADVVLLTGGGWGAGDLLGALQGILAVPSTHAVCVCGRNQGLKDQVQALSGSLAEAAGRVTVLGFTDLMNELLAAADTLVHSTGGVTCLEAAVRRCPVVVYGAPRGHARRSAQAMVRLGEADWARSQGELSELLSRTLHKPTAPEQDRLTDAKVGTVVLAAQTRPHPRRDFYRWLISAGKDCTTQLDDPAIQES